MEFKELYLPPGRCWIHTVFIFRQKTDFCHHQQFQTVWNFADRFHI